MNFIDRLKKSYVAKIICINLIIFAFTNIMFNIKYEQVDDFIMYNLYSGLDGTYNIHGIYFHPILCFLIGSLYKLISTINWHTLFLLSMQFICFTIIGTILVKKHKSQIAYVIYAIVASIIYSSLLMLIQYTSVSALLIITAFFMMVTTINKETSNKYKISYFILFTIGIMMRMQSVLIVAPFFVGFAIYYLAQCINKKENSKQIWNIVKQYLIFGSITVIVYFTNSIAYNSELYKNYMEYNNLRVHLQDISKISYEENKDFFDKIGWSENDYYLFYTFNYGDEQKYSKETLQKIIDYQISTNQYYELNLNVKEILEKLANELKENVTYSSIIFFVMFFMAILTNPKKIKVSLGILILTLGTHLLFISLNRSMQRVVIPEYILGTILLMYLVKLKNVEKNELYKPISIFIIFVTILYAGGKYQLGYKLKDYSQYQELISYTNEHKENVYLYTTPSLQFRYLAYSVYQMPPKGAFSNLRVMGGWDMFTENYYKFKQRYNLDGTFLLKKIMENK